MTCSKVFLTLSLLAIMASLMFIVVPQAQAGTPVITQSVEENNLVTLVGNVRPEVNARYDRGPVPDSLPMEHMLLQLKRSPEQERELENFIEDLHNPSSPRFHHWLSARQFGQRYGLAKQDLDNVTGWLESHGFQVNVVYDSGVLIDFSGTAAEVQQAFHTQIHQLNVEGEKHIANVSNPQIPAALAPAIAGIVSLNDFRPQSMYKSKADFTYAGKNGEVYAVVPSDLATIYNMNPLFKAGTSGQGQTIVLIEDSDIYSTSDWNTFRSTLVFRPILRGRSNRFIPRLRAVPIIASTRRRPATISKPPWTLNTPARPRPVRQLNWPRVQAHPPGVDSLRCKTY